MAGQGNRGFAYEQQRRTNTGRSSSQAGRTGESSRSGRTGESSSSGMMETAKETAQDWASSAATTAENAWDSARQGGQDLANKAEDVFDDFTGFIRRYPFAAFLGAVGVGFLIGGTAQAMTCDRS